jgi:heme exporter protein B
MTAFFRVIRYEFLLMYRQLAEWINPLLFFVLVASLFPLAISTEPSVLHIIAPGVIWVSIVLATLLSLDNLFRADYEDGFSALWSLSRWPLTRLILIRIMAATIAILLPLFIALPLVALFFQMNLIGVGALLITAILAVPTLLLIGGLGVALTITLSRSGILLALLVLPLYIPILLFATGAVVSAINGEPIEPSLAILGAFMVLSVTFLPFLIAFCLRNAD